MSNDLWASRLLMSRGPDSTGARDRSETTQLSITPEQADASGARKEVENYLRSNPARLTPGLSRLIFGLPSRRLRLPGLFRVLVLLDRLALHAFGLLVATALVQDHVGDVSRGVLDEGELGVDGV